MERFIGRNKQITLPPPSLRALREAIQDRAFGPGLLREGLAMTNKEKIYER